MEEDKAFVNTHTPGPPVTSDKGNDRRILRIGHRGAAGHAPENTLAAIRKGIALGVDFVEFDVQRSRDGRLVLLHVERVDRTTNGTGRVSGLTWEELQLLDAGDGERIPSLEAALAAASGHAGVMLEAKTPGTGPAISCAEFACAAARIGRYQKVADALFAQQSNISMSGKVEDAVNSVLTPTEARRVKSLLHDPGVQREIQTDLDEGKLVPVTGTPTLWITHAGKSQVVTFPVNYSLLKSFLDALLAKK